MKRHSLLSIEGIEKTKEIMNVTRGADSADMAIMNGIVFNSYTGEFIDNCNVLTKERWIAYVGEDPGRRINSETLVIDAKGKIVIPGFIDGHTHLADMLYCSYEFLTCALAGGTTTIITETIEPYPILGYMGIDDFLASLKDQPIKFFATAPPMVSTSKMVYGILKEDLQRLLARDDIIGLGEAYWPDVLKDPDSFLPNFLATLNAGKKIEGHTAGAKGEKLMTYLVPGVSSCHEPIKPEEVVERLRLGIHVMIREGSIRRDLEHISEIKDLAIDFRRLMLASDGIDPIDLLEKGYMEYVVQKAIDLGFYPKDAISMATINVAEYFQLDGIIGGIAPGKYADILIIPDQTTIRAEYVISCGEIIAKDGDPIVLPRRHKYSNSSLNSVRLPRALKPDDFRIKSVGGKTAVKARLIEQITDLVTKESTAIMPVKGGEIRQDTTRDILKLSAIDRAHLQGKMFTGLIKGFGLKKGAFACSSAWDTCDIIVVGENDYDMAGAVNRVKELQGGIVLCINNKIEAELPLPILGLSTFLPIKELIEKLFEIRLKTRKLGFPFKDPHRTLVTLTGAAIPFLRICEEGLIDIRTGDRVDLFIN